MPVPAAAAEVVVAMLPCSSRRMPRRLRRLDWLAPKLSWEAWRESRRSEMDEAVRELRDPDERDPDPDERDDRRLRAEDETSSALPDRTDRSDSRSDVMVEGAPMEGSSPSAWLPAEPSWSWS